MSKVQGQYLKFKKAVDACKSGDWGPDEMHDFLERTSRYLEPKAAHIFDCISVKGYRDDASEECDCAEGGVEHYETGMSEMWLYCEDGDPGHLDRGLEILRKGNDMVNYAMKLNRDAYEELDVTFYC